MSPLARRQRAASAFSLVELLTVVVIISILAALSLGGGQRILEMARQMRDVSRAGQLTKILLVDATDADGVFRVGRERDAAPGSTTLDVLQGLLDDRVLDDPTIVAAEGSVPPRGRILEERNIGFQYVAGLTQTSGTRIPLFFTKGVQFPLGNLEEVENVDPGTSAWTTKGIAVGYVGGHAEWIRGKPDGERMKLARPLGFGETPRTAVIYD